MHLHQARARESGEQTPDSGDAVYVARQPILDRRGRLFGYELLYRAAAHATTCSAPGDVAAARVFNDAILAHGLDLLTQGHPAFINFTGPLLCSDAATLLPRTATVIELREDIVVDDSVVEACRRLHDLGYQLALDDFDGHSDAVRLLEYAKFVKVDVLRTPESAQVELVEQLSARGVRLVAEKVETAEGARHAHYLGYHLFQGFYFCKPSTVTAGAVPARRLSYMELLATLNRPNLTIRDLEEPVKRDASICYRVLRSVNSAAFGLRQEIRSIREALMMLGLGQIQKWASVWALAGVNNGGTPEIVAVTILRARCCELLGNALSGAEAGAEFFLLGLCSTLDAILGQPLAVALEQLPLSSVVRDALLGNRNLARSVLDAVIAYERGAWDEATSVVTSLGLPPRMLPSAYADALNWARELTRSADAAA